MPSTDHDAGPLTPTLTVKEPELLLAACPLGEVARSSLA
jgi:hypothetical protein